MAVTDRFHFIILGIQPQLLFTIGVYLLCQCIHEVVFYYGCHCVHKLCLKNGCIQLTVIQYCVFCFIGSIISKYERCITSGETERGIITYRILIKKNSYKIKYPKLYILRKCETWHLSSISHFMFQGIISSQKLVICTMAIWPEFVLPVRSWRPHIVCHFGTLCMAGTLDF